MYTAQHEKATFSCKASDDGKKSKDASFDQSPFVKSIVLKRGQGPSVDRSARLYIGGYSYANKCCTNSMSKSSAKSAGMIAA